MNHLAHALLSGPDAATLTGNLAADYLRKRECLNLPEELQRGVRLHRLIDFTTDNDPDVRNAWALLRDRHGKYAGVVYDIYCDYLLTRHWSTLAPVALPAFAKASYARLAEQSTHLPDALAARFARMSGADWLTQYGSYDGLERVFTRFRTRLSKPELLDGVIETLRREEASLERLFLSFYPRLEATCAGWRERN